jgi:hypothetical protein
MPPVQVYAVDFSNGNLEPSLDTHGWGAMKLGDSGPDDKPGSFSDAKGLNLSVYRAPPGSTTHAAIGVHVVLGPNVLPLARRLLLATEFDRPNAHLQYVQQPSNTVPPPPPPSSPTPEPWAVGLTVKLGNEQQVHNEPLVAVTCQFNRQVNGARLNTPFNQEGDQAPVLLSPLDYAANPQHVYQMEHSFCGIGALAFRSIGNGALTIGPPGTLRDQRVYSNTTFAAPQQNWIGALGVTLVTLSGVGQIMMRLRKFSVSMWA